jgi:TPR repeat protein
MTGGRAALVAALLCAASPAAAQSNSAAGTALPLGAAIASYRAGDLVTAQAAFQALAQNNPDAEAWLGVVLIDRGNGREGLKKLQEALAAGSPEAANQLALAYAQGLAGLPRDDARAAELFGKAAQAGHLRAELNIGILYFRGQGVKRDLVQARAWLEKAAATDDPYALYALARAIEDSDGAAQADPVRAADLYRRAAEKGHPLAALRYGLALSGGDGVKRDPLAAQHWLLAAQNDGVPEAALALGDMTARTPPSRDKAETAKVLQSAIAWYTIAANAGVPSAQFKLGNAFYVGAGAPQDISQAVFWYDRAARQGLPEAQYVLGLILARGLAGPAAPVDAYKWQLLAERGGFTDARTAREKAATQISATDRKRAEDLAASFAPVLERPISDVPPPLGQISP